MAYTAIDDPSAHFQTDLYTGNGSNDLSLTNDGNSDLQPDWVWIKSRSSASLGHRTYDSSRGAAAGDIRTHGANAETAESGDLESFDSDGFTVDDHGDINTDGATFVAWQWKANGSSTSSNTSGTITSAVQANTTAGFSIVTYAGTGDAATVGHGLGAAPTLLIVKNRDSAEHWMVGHHHLPSGFQDAIFLNLQAGKDTDAGYFNDTAPTSTLFSIGTNAKGNTDGDNIVVYAFAEKQGYSKFGSYKGNGAANGPFVYTGFSPAFIIIKMLSADRDWTVMDNKRPGYNPNNYSLKAQSAAAEYTGRAIDILSNGFKIRENPGDTNIDGTKAIYAAFAHQPFVTSGGVPCTAR